MPKPPKTSQPDKQKTDTPSTPSTKKLRGIDIIGMIFLIFAIAFFASSLITSQSQHQENQRKQADYLAQSARQAAAAAQNEGSGNITAPPINFRQLLGIAQPDQTGLSAITLPRFALSQEANNAAPADSITSDSITSDEITIGGAQQKDIIFLNFFASWCRPCRSEHPLLVKLSERYDIPMIGVIFQDAPQATAKFLSDMGNPYDFIGADGQLILSGQLGVQGIPASFIIGPNGDILWEHRGEITDQILSNLTKILKNYNIPVK